MNDRLNIDRHKLALKFITAKHMIAEEYVDKDNCVYKTNTSKHKKNEPYQMIIDDRAKAIRSTLSLIHNIETAIFYDADMEPIYRDSNTIKACEVFVTYILTNGGLIPADEYLEIQNKNKYTPWNLTNYLVERASKIMSDNFDFTMTQEISDVFKSIFETLYKTISLSGGRGVGKGEILKTTCIIGATKPKKGDICIETKGDTLILEQKGEQSRILAESHMMSSGFMGINSKLEKMFPNVINKDVDYVNNYDELSSLPVECRKYIKHLIANSWSTKDVDRSSTINTYIDELSPMIFSDYDNIIFKDSRSYDDLLMILSLKEYVMQDDFDILTISALDDNGDIWEISVTKSDIMDTQKIYKIWNTYIEYENNYSANGRFRVKQSTLRIRKDL